MSTPAAGYAGLVAHHRRVYRLEHLQAVAAWDQRTNMPPAAARARAEAQGEMSALLQQIAEDPRLDALFDEAARETLGEDDARNLALMQRQRTLTRAVPEQLVSRREELSGAAVAAWNKAREAGDWKLLAPALKELVAVIREVADRIGDATGTSRYDALLEVHESGLRTARLDAMFADLRRDLPAMVKAVMERQRNAPAPLEPKGPFDTAHQHDLCRKVIATFGFDFTRGRLDATPHPFTGGVPEDVRLTTRYNESAVMSALQGSIHEAGHGCYQQNLPRDWLGQPVAGPHSASLHEGQALTFERQIAPRLAFCKVLSPLMIDAFGTQPAFDPANLHALMTRVKPGRVRIEADEITYPLHIILRYDIERALVEGAIDVDALPTVWAEKMKQFLGVDAPGDDALGAMQDVHWPSGLFGYFPTYLLGAFVAAQCVEHLSSSMDVDEAIASGDLSAVTTWLRENIWSQGARRNLDGTIAHATGRPLDSAAWRRHIERRYGAASGAAA